MRIASNNLLGLLMAPDKLPSCFSCEESADERLSIALPPPRRAGYTLRDMRAAIARTTAARRAERRNSSAAAW